MLRSAAMMLSMRQAAPSSAPRVGGHLKRTPSSIMRVEEVGQKQIFLRNFQEDDFPREQVVYSLSFAGNDIERDFESDNLLPLIDDRMKNQLQKSYKALLSPSSIDAQAYFGRLPPRVNLEDLGSLHNKRVMRKLPPLEYNDEIVSSEDCPEPLPISISDIRSSKLDCDTRAIVVTDVKSPFRIVSVNTAWEGLCGYDRAECHGRPLGPLLQGPETDTSTVTALVSKLLAGEQTEAVLINYTKGGRKFLNNVRVGPILDEMGKTVHFVGVLNELTHDLRSESAERNLSLPFIS